jgi:cytochrome c5
MFVPSHLARAAALAACVAATGGAPPQAATANPALALTSKTIDLPTSDRALPIGPGVETVTNNCLTCHSTGMIINQPALARATWDAEVRKMIGVYKAPIAPEDIATIVTHLATINGVP